MSGNNFHGPIITSDDLIRLERIGEIQTVTGQTKSKGQQCIVWKALLHGHTYVALKEVPLEKQIDEGAVANFREEVKIMSEINHPNICLFIGAHLADRKMLLVTELLARDLDDLLFDKRESLTLLEKIKLAREICSGMEWLHHCGVVHLDLKPANILLDSHNVAKIHDFGYSRIVHSHRVAFVPEPNKFKLGGSPLYAAPERLVFVLGNTGGPSVLPQNLGACDVYSYGIIMWQIIMRVKPFEVYTQDLKGFARAVVERGERPVIPEDLHGVLKEIMENCWHQYPEKRPTFDALFEPLDSVMIDLAIWDEGGRQFWRNNFFQSQKCEICKYNFNSTDRIAMVLKCNHVFCKTCIMKCTGNNTVWCPYVGIKCKSHEVTIGDLRTDVKYARLVLKTEIPWPEVQPSEASIGKKPSFGDYFSDFLGIDRRIFQSLTEVSACNNLIDIKLPGPTDPQLPALIRKVSDDRLTEFLLNYPASSGIIQQEKLRREHILRLYFFYSLMVKDGMVSMETFGKVISVFGPTSQGSGHLLLTRIYKLLAHPWLFGGLSQNDAFSILRNKQVGDFLVRLSSSQVGLVVSLVISNQVVHIRLEHLPGKGWRLPGQQQYSEDIIKIFEANSNTFKRAVTPDERHPGIPKWCGRRDIGYYTPYSAVASPSVTFSFQETLIASDSPSSPSSSSSSSSSSSNNQQHSNSLISYLVRVAILLSDPKEGTLSELVKILSDTDLPPGHKEIWLQTGLPGTFDIAKLKTALQTLSQF